MTHSLEVSGRCLCGAVGVSALAAGDIMDACHCNMCRRWSGGPMLAIGVDGEVKFDGEEHIAVYDSSDWAQRGFCRNCGTHLFYRLKGRTHYSLPAGLLDPGARWRFEKEIFIDEQPDYYAFSNETRRMTGEEAIAESGDP